MQNNMFLYRRKAKLRQLDIARELGVTEQTISNFETGRTPIKPDMAFRVSKVLKVKPEEVFPDLFS